MGATLRSKQTNHPPEVGPPSVAASLNSPERPTGIGPRRRAPKGIGDLLNPVARPAVVHPKAETRTENSPVEQPSSDLVPQQCAPIAAADSDAAKFTERNFQRSTEAITLPKFPPAATRSQPRSTLESVIPQVAAPRLCFREKYCKMQGIAPDKFGRHLFIRCLRLWVMPPITLLWVFNRRSLINDFRLIDQIAEVSTYREFLGALETFTYANRESGFLRETLRIRLSAKLLMRFGSELLHPADQETSRARPTLLPPGNPDAHPRIER